MRMHYSMRLEDPANADRLSGDEPGRCPCHQIGYWMGFLTDMALTPRGTQGILDLPRGAGRGDTE